MGKCRLCRGNESVPVIELGSLPIAHQFSETIAQSQERQVYPMQLEVCPLCGMAQLAQTIPPEILYTNYNYCFSTWKNQPHVADECELIKQMMPNGTIVEVGCNDGLFLSAMAEYGDYKCIGIEPNKVSSKLAQSKGLTVINKFFEDTIDNELAEIDVNVVVARQVLEHINDVDLFLAEANRMLVLGGIICLEVPNTDIALTTGDVSCLWEEHVNYFTPASLQAALEGFGFKLRVNKTYKFSGEAILMIAEKIENRATFKKPSTVDIKEFLNYSDSVAEYKTLLIDTLHEYRNNDYSIVLYGSGCRASTAIHSLELIAFIDSIVDDQVEKQGLYMPQTMQPVTSSDVLKGKENVLFLLAVNNENETKVIDNIAGLNIANFETLSLHSPTNIKNELQRVSSLITYAT